MADSIKGFPHRKNPDGSWDSICGRCFLTIATKPDETDLKAAEDAHDCDALALSYVLKQQERQEAG
jgi:hypothetical protein